MFNIVSLIIGVVALLFAVIAFIPLLGWANWLIIPLAVIGAAVGTVSRGTAGRNSNLFVIAIAALRLMLRSGFCLPARPTLQRFELVPLVRPRRPDLHFSGL